MESSMDTEPAGTRWVLAPQPSEEEVERLQEHLKKGGSPLSEPLARLLLQRGIDEGKARSFFLPSLEELHDPFLMKGMGAAVERLTEAVSGNEKILVLGDYDVDGTTAVAMLADELERMGKSPLTHIPDRYEEGYGISHRAVDRAIEGKVGLILTLDCGIKGHESIQRALDAGIDTIVCDHHRPDQSLPPSYAVLDPERSDDPYPFPGLSGCGVAFKLLHAFYIQHELAFEKLHAHFDLLAISIAADIVPMTDENRIFTHFGLQRIEKDPRPGIRALKECSGVDDERMDVTQLVFTIGPRINAAGRMDHGSRAVELLNAGEEEAISGGGLLDERNQERRNLDQRMTREALEQIREKPRSEEDHTTVVHHPDWHKGVIGIVASRLIEHYYRPTIVFCGSGSEVTGSARSVKGFDIHQALSRCSHYLQRFGGHRYAAGMTLCEEDLPAFRKAFEEEVRKAISPDLLVPEFQADTELDLKRIEARFFWTLQRFGPFGPGNLQPLFLTRRVVAESVKGVGKDKAHLKLLLYQEDDHGSRFPAIAFRMGSLYPRILTGESFHILYHIEMNEFKGKRSIQLRIKDIKFGEAEEVLATHSRDRAFVT
ncbi:MAG: single-stranded-DNA-specific exonuclease RecJ [Flavobacteriales bacterium]